MRTSIKLLLWLFAGTGALFAVLVALLFFVDVNLYRARIERHVSTTFGRDVVFAGPLSLDRSLTPRFVVDGLKIANPDWASRPFLAVVDKFDIRVSLIPLLQGKLEIVSLEFHGVDLLLETAPDGANNFTFGRSRSGEPTTLPAIKRMTLYDAAITFVAPDRPVKRLQLEKATARKVPGEPVELEVETTLNRVPVTIALRGEPPSDKHPQDPWQITLLGEAGDLYLRFEGSVADPADWRRGEYRLGVKGRHLDDLEALSGYTLPEAARYELGATIRFDLDEYLTVSDLTGHIGGSDVRGKLHWDISAAPSAIKLRLESQQLDTSDLGLGDPLTRNGEQDNKHYLDKPLDLGALGGVNLDVEVRAQRLDGLAKGMQDIELVAQADQQHLRLATVKATVDDTHIAASAALPWGERLATLAPKAVSLKTLLQHTELDIRAQVPDGAYYYATNLLGRPLKLSLSSIEATARPDKALTIEAETAFNDKPVSLNLKAEPLAALVQRPTGPWRDLTLEARGEDIRLDASGSVTRPFETGGFDVSYTLSGAQIDTLLPLQGSWSATGHYTDHPDHRLFDALQIRVGRSDIGGRVAVYREGQRTRLVANLDAGRIDLDEILPDNAGKTKDGVDWDQPLDISGFGAIDLDTEVHIQRLEGLAKPIQNIRLSAQSSGQTLTLEPVKAMLDGTRFDGRLQLPWGERLGAISKKGLSIQGLVQLADLELNGRPPAGKLRHRTYLMGHPFDIELTGFDAGARPGKALQIRASALLDDTPLQVNLQAEPLAQLLQRPSGPWQNLAMEVRGEDIQFDASGRVDRPFEASGFAIDYALRGAEVDALLPMFNLVLPLEGAYSLTGHFADQPDRLVFDQLKFKSGNNDISGDISVYQEKPRPRIVANFNSEQIYLSNLLPVSKTDAVPDAERRVIPDYNLPIERMREIDSEITFKGKRLRTTVGDLGDISFKATLKDGVFRLDTFNVRGWAGAFVESDGMIDTSQEPPLIKWNWIGRQLNYGLLLEQAGFAETVKGTIDVTLRLSSTGRTRREFLGNANGQLIIVGQEGKFGSRRLDLWGSDLVTTMLSPDWHREDMTELNCVVANISIEEGIARSDELLVDTRRITIAASGTLELEREELDLVLAPSPKRASLVSLTTPVRITGTLAAPEVEATRLPRNRMAAAGTGLLAGLINPGYLIFTFSQTGSGQANPCTAAVEQAMMLKGAQD